VGYPLVIEPIFILLPKNVRYDLHFEQFSGDWMHCVEPERIFGTGATTAVLDWFFRHVS